MVSLGSRQYAEDVRCKGGGKVWRKFIERFAVRETFNISCECGHVLARGSAAIVPDFEAPSTPAGSA